MFSSNTKAPSFEVMRDFYVPAPENYTANTKELTSGLDKVTASYMVIGKNCESSCVKALELQSTNYLNESEQHNYDSCVRSCFVRRLNEHFPENKEITDFAYSSAFEYKQRDLLNLNISKIAFKTAPSSTSQFKNIESIASAFNNYFL
jgi:hypothetical protein